jgi:DNA polymerase III epsilon subunit-like protein
MDGHLLRFDKTSRFAYLDFETYNLCLNFSKNRPWQTGIIEVVGGQIVDSHDIIVNWLNDCPDLYIEPHVAIQNHYSEERVRRDGIEQRHAFEAIWPVLKKVDYIVWHNGIKFDIYMLKAWAEENGVDWRIVLPKMIDTKALAQGIKMGIHYNPKQDNFLEYQYRMANIVARGVKTKLSVLAKEFQIPFEEEKLHDAIYDLTVNKAVFEKLIQQIEI